MGPWHQPLSPAGLIPADQSGVQDDDVAWKRPLCALTGRPAPDVGFPPSAPALWIDLTLGQQYIAAAILSHLALSPTAGAAMVDLQRERLRDGALRRSDDIETLTALVRLLVGCPISTKAEVEDIHGAYQHLRQCHWWPSGPEDLPLAALLVAGAQDAMEPISRIEQLHLVLSEGDEVPGDVCALIALSGSVPDLVETQVLMRISALRTELLLSGIAVQEGDIAALLALATIPGEPVVVMQEFITERRKAVQNARNSPLTIALAADAVVLRHLDGTPRLVYISALAIRAWLLHRQHQPRPSTRIIRRFS